MFQATFLATDITVLILYVASAWVILRYYRHTRNVGLLILGCGVLVWPLLDSLLVSIRTGNLWLDVFLPQASKVIQAGLILTGLVAIERSIKSSRISGH